MICHLQRITETQNKVVITDRMWARLLSSTNQPSFLTANDVANGRPQPPSSQCPLLNERKGTDEKNVTTIEAGGGEMG